MSGVEAGRGEGGFTLIELLVSILLLGVIGSVVTAGLVSSMQHTGESQARIEAMAELQRSAERITREIRAACPVEEMADDDVTVAVVRGGETSYHQFYRDTAGDQDLLRHVVKDDPGDPAVGGTILLNQLEDEALFTFLDEAGDEAGHTGHVRTVQIALSRTLQNQDHTVRIETVAMLRNGGRGCE